ncbi:MAG TPA: Pr6Pr family membrane protein [Streptosporangiaceae bacterium]|jgi:hypothetical protein
MLSRVWNAVLALVIAASLIIQIVLLVQGKGDVNAAGNEATISLAARLVRLFSYFTIQSNLLVLALATSLVLSPARDGRVWRVLQADALLGIVITGLVYATVLAGQVQLHGISVWLNVGLHYFAPLWTLAGWLLFGPRPRLDRRTIGWMFAWPVLWLVYTFAHGAAAGWYPYPFLDVGLHGYAIAVRNAAGVVVLGVIIIGVMTLIDRRLPVAARLT